MTIKSFLTTFIFLFLLISCSTSYIPNSINTPLLKNKNELQVGANYGLSTYFVPAIEPQLSYAISKNIGVMVNGAYSLNHYDKSDTLYLKRNFTEAGIGYYKKFAEKFQYEIYGGFGRAKISEQYESDESISLIHNSATYNRYFIQPTIAYTTNAVAISFTPRINYVDFLKTSKPLSNSVVVEPVFSFQFGRKFVFQTQVGGSIFLKQFNADYNPIMLSFGVKYKFGRK